MFWWKLSGVSSDSPLDLFAAYLAFKVSDNPQIFHQALLLMSSFARLAPEAVLRNIMPIFTFMGSNVFHRDDDYSFKVVQKVINHMLPRSLILILDWFRP
jgi:hypothetical protein